ncbi:MAG: lamin tail domain-containing protein, partial [Oscillospiraceae bacterium]|nr:lamin tail domain-containing protein [Oscillospiraceae bacterium]
MQKRSKKLLAFLLCLVMVLSAFPMGVLAADGTGADHVVINQAYGGGGNKGAEYKNDFVELYNPTDKDVDLSGWSVQYASKSGTFNNVTNLSGVIKAGGYYLVQMAAGTGGTLDLPTPDAIGTAAMAGKEFKVALANNTEAITGINDENVVDFLGAGAANEYEGDASAPLASNTTSLNRINGIDTNQNSKDFIADTPNPHNSGSTTPNPEPSPEVSPDPSIPPSETPQLEIVPISTALAGAADTEFKVKGVVTLVDGKNVYLQDNTGAICVRMAAEFSDISLGDTIIGTGNRADYNGLPQLGSAAYEKSSGLTLSAKAATIASLSAADVCSYVKLEKLTVESSAGTTINLSDGTNSIQLYKAVTDGLAIAEGDIIDICAAVGIFSGKPQLRNTLPDEITIVDKAPESTEPPQEEKPVIADGNYVIYAPSYNKALSSTKTGNYNVGVDVSISSGVMSGFAATEVWTVKNNSDGTISIAQNDKKLGMASQYSSMNLGAENDAWEIVSLGNDLYNVKNVGRGNYIEWYAQYSNWSTYNSSYAATDGQFQLAFYPVTQIPEVPPTPSEPPQDEEPVIADGRYIIWAPGYNMSIPSVYAGFYNTGVAVEESNGVLSGYSASEIWEVENNSDGTISISYGGKKLAM